MIGILRILGILTIFGLDWLFEKIRNAYMWVLFFLLITCIFTIIRE